ncbi:uncharacterized protein CIMG_09035 [Coccidioides immitis RS]|uniref:Mannosyltransferase 1, CMT1 n=1 Tax=Coccidioides immitis (strain RS) TaxID=246410 RepID=J3K1H7_COCIM|nr:uncharacterized protein CIMG_09035 [Coccidioides immitis RS]EAS27831.3 hypothetical protein CIMG_09035 [Coccidioides immitis RS]
MFESVPLLSQFLKETESDEHSIDLSSSYRTDLQSSRSSTPLWSFIGLQIARFGRRCRAGFRYQNVLYIKQSPISRRSRVCCLLFKALKITLSFGILFVLVSAIEAILYPSYQNPPKHYTELHQRIFKASWSGRGNVNHEKVFIAANIINEKLIRGPWGQALMELVEILGEENVFISIYENDSGEGTSAALNGLRDALLCNSSIVTGDHIPLSQFPTVTLPNGEERTKRIAYLAEVRNRVLRPLDPSYNPGSDANGFRRTSTKFDKVLFLNDVYFSPIDAVQLLFSTNADPGGRARYRAACAVDFISPVKFYDTFVVRDAEGHSIGTPFFPWFSTAGEGQSREDVLAGKDSVPVRSCWGGMAAFDAKTFQRPQSSETLELLLPFRHDPEPFWEAAECCLIFADIEQHLGTPDPEKASGVFINPYIRAAYSRRTWEWLPFVRRYERIFNNFQRIGSAYGYPRYNPRRLHEPGQLVKQKVWVTDAQRPLKGSYQEFERLASAGGFCGERTMFVMQRDVAKANTNGGGKNWKEIQAP